jgi:hypothetical protein
MSRDDKMNIEPGGFPVYGKEQLPKIDSMRRDKSQPDFFGVPILTDDQVLYTTGKELGGKPASCYTCVEQNKDFTCERIGPEVKVAKVIGHRDSGESIEYWPCCSMHNFTPNPRSEAISYHETLDSPGSIGLIWINAPKPGQKYGGANCGGVNGGDDCDSYIVKSGEKWDSEQAFCRVLQHVVDADAVCTAWKDDDILTWEDAQQLIKGTSVDGLRKQKLAKAIIGRDDG